MKLMFGSTVATRFGGVVKAVLPAVDGKSFLEALPETRGSVFDEKYRQAVRDKAPVSFEASLEQAPRDGSYSVQVHPHAEGISVFFQRHKALRPVPAAEKPEVA